MKKSAYFSDVLFSFFFSAVVTVVLFRGLGLTPLTALLLAAACGLLVSFATASLLKSKRKNLDLKKSDETQKRKLLAHLALLSDEEKTRFFQSVLSDGTQTVKRFSKLRLYTDEAFYFLFFRFSPVTADEVASASRLKTGKQKILLCDRIDEDAAALCARLHIRFQTGEAVYAQVKERALLPEKYLSEEPPQNKKERRLRLAFAKSNSRRFLFSGALVLFASLLTPYRLYYLTFGGALLIAALFIRLFGYS